MSWFSSLLLLASPVFSFPCFSRLQCQPHKRGELLIEFDVRFPCHKLSDQHKAAIMQLLPGLDASVSVPLSAPLSAGPCGSVSAAPHTGLPFSPSLPSSLSALSMQTERDREREQHQPKNPFAIDSSPATGCFGAAAMPISPQARSQSSSLSSLPCSGSRPFSMSGAQG